jgi:hypothetical protein
MTFDMNNYQVVLKGKIKVKVSPKHQEVLALVQEVTNATKCQCFWR